MRIRKISLIIFVITLALLNSQEQTIKFSHDSGFYPNEFKLTLSSSDNSKIFYTVDSSNPTNSSTAKEYTDPINIIDRTKEPNLYSAIIEDESSPVSISRGNNFKAPVYSVDKPMVIRAVSKKSDGTFSKIMEKTYFVTTGDLKQYEDLTIISLVTNPENLFDPDYGIYVTGTQYQNWKKSPQYDPAQNPWDKNGICNYYSRGKEWEREASVTFFEKGKVVLEQNIGIRLKGRKDLATSNMKNAVLFLDGEYWGYYLIQEKIDDEFMENNYHVPRENVAMIKEGEKEEGPQEETDNFNSFCEVYSKKDLSDEKNYQDITDYIDIDSMIEHYATGIYLGTTDWPGQNAGLWRNYGSKIEGNKFGDGKWRFMTFDMDYTMGAGWGGVGPDTDNFQKVMSKNKDSPTNLFVALFKNDDFKKKFAKVYCDYANEVMNIDRIKEMVSRYKEENTDLVAYSQLRWWGADSKMEGYSHWKSNYINALDNIQRFFENRARSTLQHMKQHFGLKGELNELTINIKGEGKIQVNTVIPTLKEGSWTGKYYSDVPVTLSVVDSYSKDFKGWSGDVESDEKTMEVTLSKAMKIVANFN